MIVVTLGFVLLDGPLDMVIVLPAGVTAESGPDPFTIVNVATCTPGIVVAEFGSVDVTPGRVELAAFGLAGIVIMLVLPCGTVTIVTALPPGAAMVEPLGPLESVVMTTPGLELGELADEVADGLAGELAGELAETVTMLVAPEGTVTRLEPTVEVTPEGPPRIVITWFGLAELLPGIVAALLPPIGIVTTLGPTMVMT